MPLADYLARLNACLNATSGILLLFGYHAIRNGHPTRHKRFMLGACTCSALFLISYVTRVLLSGTHRLNASGVLRSIYLAILSSHMALAALVLPLAIITVTLGLRGRFARHKKIARITFPIWIYVSATGVLVYFMLYHYPGHVQ